MHYFDCMPKKARPHTCAYLPRVWSPYLICAGSGPPTCAGSDPPTWSGSGPPTCSGSGPPKK